MTLPAVSDEEEEGKIVKRAMCVEERTKMEYLSVSGVPGNQVLEVDPFLAFGIVEELPLVNRNR